MTKEEREKAKATKIAKKKEPMKDIIVNTLSGKSGLYDLCEVVGVKERVLYYNMIEKKAPKKIRTIQNPFVVVKDVFDKGFVFKDGFEIRHVDSKFWSLYNENIREVRERKPV
jgi:flagellar basal body-associated protein FliL